MERVLALLRPAWVELKKGNVSALLSRYGDLLLPVGVMLVIGTLFVPLPPALISLLIVVNLAVSVIVLATSLYITTPTQLTSYPTILLLTTVFRLTLSVSATRAILTLGTAGGVIEALGQITAQGSIIVGAVMFVTILVVQFIVVAKGSERVAEVAARFTLDAMPGKQMSIDADMRSGLITQEQARRARTALQKESQLYGAMDGAMKFVKGDAIATIVIAMVNIAGGLATGVLVRGMTFAQAGHKYTIMTIGDGLAAIISSMLITVSAGIVVTRVSTDEETSHVGAELPKLRSALYYDLGVLLPSCYVSGDAPLEPFKYFIAIKEVPVVYGSIRPDCVYVNDSADNIRVFGLEGEDVRNPADLKPGAWIPAAQRPIAEMAGLKVWEPAEVITLHLSMVMRKYAHDFIGIQESQALLDFAARGAPKLVEEVVPKVVTIHQFTDVLQRLAQEGISIRDVKSILDALSEWGRIEKDPVMLTEYVRSSMKRYISFRYTGGRDTLFVYLLDPEIEDVIRGAIRRTSTGSFLSLDPAIAHDILDAMRREIAELPPGAQKPVVITDMELRRFVRKMVELEFPTLTVLSYQELAPELNVQPVGRITMRPPRPQDQQFLPDAGERLGGALSSPALA